MDQPTAPRQTSQARIDANRRNAQKSTGPRTAEGKAQSSRNHLLHGLRANKHILLDDDPAEFTLLLQDHLDRFQPVGTAEEELVLRIAACHWRLNRIFAMEAGIYRGRLQSVAAEDARCLRAYEEDKEYAGKHGQLLPPAPPAPEPGDLLARAFTSDCGGGRSLLTLTRYETSLERSLDRSIRRLKMYQSARLAAADSHPAPEPASPPAPTGPHTRDFHSNPKNGGIAPRPRPDPAIHHPLAAHKSPAPALLPQQRAPRGCGKVTPQIRDSP